MRSARGALVRERWLFLINFDVFFINFQGKLCIISSKNVQFTLKIDQKHVKIHQKHVKIDQKVKKNSDDYEPQTFGVMAAKTSLHHRHLGYVLQAANDES